VSENNNLLDKVPNNSLKL